MFPNHTTPDAINALIRMQEAYQALAKTHISRNFLQEFSQFMERAKNELELQDI